MSTITITEALAEIKTIGKRLKKKRDFVAAHVGREDGLKDPFLDQGGSVEVLRQDLQAIGALEARVVVLREAIAHSNRQTTISNGDSLRTIEGWLVWRRDIAPAKRAFIVDLLQGIERMRSEAGRRGVPLRPAGEPAAALTDFLVHLDERELAQESEDIDRILGELDGQLSLKNATTTVTVPD